MRAGWFRLSISVGFGLQWRDGIDDCNFDLISIRIDLIPIRIDRVWPIFIIFWLKDQKRPSKCWLFNKKLIYKWKMVKNDWIFINNFEIFDQIQSNFD